MSVYQPQMPRDFIGPSIAIQQMRPDYYAELQKEIDRQQMRKQQLAQYQLLQQKAKLNDLVMRNMMGGADAGGEDPVAALIRRQSANRVPRKMAVMPGQPPTSVEVAQPEGEMPVVEINPDLAYTPPFEI